MRVPTRILLISPKGPLYRYRGGIFKKSLRYMPLTLPTLAALVPPEIPSTITCVDEGIQEVDLNTEADLVGLTVITGTAPRAYQLADHFRRRGKTVVLGGPHVTLVPEDAAPHADCLVVGYAEDEWPRLLRDFRRGGLKKRYIQSPDLDLAGRPAPLREVLPRQRYLTHQVFEATRGCTHRCEFCVVPSAWGRRPFQKPVAEVVADLLHQRAKRAIFVDLNLIADRSYAEQLFRALIPLEIQWYGLATTLLHRDTELLDLAARSGCRGLLMGLESVSPEVLRQSGKGFNNPDSYHEMIEDLHRYGIALQGCFVFGNDGDTIESIRRTAEWAVEARVDLPRFAILTPFPGTPLYHRLEAEGRILHQNWQFYDGQHVVFQPDSISVEDLSKETEAAWKKAYRLTSMIKRLRSTAAPWWTAWATNLGYRHYAHNLDRYYTCDWMIASSSAP